jgi:hypothetical protein
MLSVPTLSDSFTAGGPTSSKPCTATAEVVCTTQRLNVGGRVYVLNLDQRLDLVDAPSLLTVANADTLFESIVAHPKTKVHAMEHFTSPRKFSVTPVDNNHYEEFFPHRGTLTEDQFFTHFAQWPTLVSHQAHPMSTVIVAVDKPPATQSLTYTVHAQSLTRWPVHTVTGQLMTKVKVGSHKEVVDERSKAERDHRGTR